MNSLWQPSIYPVPQQDILLLDTPSELEKQIAIARRYVTGTYTDAYAQVQSAVSKWIGVEHAVESAFPFGPQHDGILTNSSWWSQDE